MLSEIKHSKTNMVCSHRGAQKVDLTEQEAEEWLSEAEMVWRREMDGEVLYNSYKDKARWEKHVLVFLVFF